MVGAIRLVTVPAGFWTSGEVRLAGSLLTFDGAGPPLFIALARLVNLFVRDPFMTAVALSVAASVAAAVLIGLSCGRIFGSAWVGAGVALAALLSPAFLMFGPKPDVESVAIAFVAATLFFFVGRRPELFAISAAAAIGSRPQMAPAMLAMFVIGIAVMPRKGRSLATFVVTMLILFVPLREVVLLDRSPQFRRDLVIRFVAHPWGGKFLSYPLLAAAAAGALVALKRHRHAVVLALAAFAAIHVATSVFTASPIDGVRPVLPALVPIAFFAVAAFARWPAVAALLSGVFAAGSIAYTWPALAQHARNEAPPVAAMRYADARSVVIAAPDLAPFSGVALTPERLDEFARKPDVDVQLVVHGRSEGPGAIVFERRASDVCRKLVSDRFHVVSLVPQPPSQRYTARSGVYHLESSPERAGWRWLAREAVIEPVSGGAARLRFRLPDDAPLHSNRLTVGGQVVEIARGATVDIALPPTS
ncbi:MAG: hypothetical protein ACXW2P_03405, partial [Thermoanaerobaculia bacterium]